jgi:hypothetical protein
LAAQGRAYKDSANRLIGLLAVEVANPGLVAPAIAALMKALGVEVSKGAG